MLKGPGLGTSDRQITPRVSLGYSVPVGRDFFCKPDLNSKFARDFFKNRNFSAHRAARALVIGPAFCFLYLPSRAATPVLPKPLEREKNIFVTQICGCTGLSRIGGVPKGLALRSAPAQFRLQCHNPSSGTTGAN